MNELALGAPLLVLAGSTAVGKTSLALRFARALDGELIGADSVQVYRGFDIGSGKPSADELDGVPHHLIDVLEPEDAIDAMKFAGLADRAIADCVKRGRVPIVVGGTGLWLRALVRGLVELPPVDPELRARLTAEAAGGGLHAKLTLVDPDTAARVHENDHVRVVRALEVYEQCGKTISSLRKAHALGGPRYNVRHYVLRRPPEELTARIEQRLDAMIEAGFADEVRGLLERHDRSARAFASVGYAEMVQHVLGNESLSETRRKIRKSTRTYARRQMTWFNGEPGITAVLPPNEILDALPALRAHLRPRT